MALKDWKKVKSGIKRLDTVTLSIYPLVYIRKSNENDALVLKYYYSYNPYEYYDSSNKYEVLRNNISLFRSKTKSEAIKYMTEYMRKH